MLCAAFSAVANLHNVKDIKLNDPNIRATKTLFYKDGMLYNGVVTGIAVDEKLSSIFGKTVVLLTEDRANRGEYVGCTHHHINKMGLNTTSDVDKLVAILK